MNKTLIIGWDAADWRGIDPLLQAGKLPNLEKMIAAYYATQNPYLREK